MNRLVMKDKRALQVKQAGFTLLEVLIAVGITAMIGLGSWQILNSALRTNESTQARLAEMNALQKTMLIMSRDFKQMAPRSIRDGFGDYGYALTNKVEFYDIEFTRVGWRNPLNDKRADVQRVAYELEGDKLVRHHWLVLDRAQDSDPKSRTLLKGVTGLEFKFMNDSGSWEGEWPSQSLVDKDSDEEGADPREKNNTLPKAIKIQIDTDRFDKVVRVFELVSYQSGTKIKAVEDDSSNNDPP